MPMDVEVEVNVDVDVAGGDSPAQSRALMMTRLTRVTSTGHGVGSHHNAGYHTSHVLPDDRDGGRRAGARTREKYHCCGECEYECGCGCGWVKDGLFRCRRWSAGTEKRSLQSAGSFSS